MLKLYFTGIGSYGFYRGYNNLFYNKNYNIPEKLLTDRIVSGFAGCIWHINPILQPVFIYGIIRRCEKKYIKEHLVEDDYYH